ncbi:phytoene desaturase family protein, partial [Actinomadura adrarensis]
LRSAHGLEYVLTDPAVVLPQADGDALVMHRDIDATADEIARWSKNDAESFRGLLAEWSNGLSAAHARWNSALPNTNRDYQELRGQSAWDVVHDRFTNPTIRSFMLWLALATIQDPRRPGTGVLPSAIAAGRINYGWTTPIGGSSALPAALIRQIEAHGGTVACSSPVDTIDIEHGRAVAVRTRSGQRVKARNAVVSSAHLVHLPDMLSGIDVPSDLSSARDTWRPGLSVFAVHAALRHDLAFPTRNGPIQSVAAGFGTTEGIARQLTAVDNGDPWVLVVNQTLIDRTRAPGDAATFKILTIAPYERADGRPWHETKQAHAEALLALVRSRTQGLEPEDILAVRAESPVDVAAHNQHNLGGSCHGGEFVTKTGEVIPGWPTYRTSVPGLYLTGATTHPGGSVSARPGRNTARTVLTDLALNPARVMSQA